MAFFKFRKSGDEQAAAPAQSESVEALRKRATFRLIGAAVLVLAGVIGFPLLFDSQPRPVPVDIAIEIPDKTKVRPLTVPVSPVTPATTQVPAAVPAAQSPVVQAPAVPAPLGAPSPETKVMTDKSPASIFSKENKAMAIEKSDDNAPKKEVFIGQKDSSKSTSNGNDGAKALALLEGKAPEVSGESRFVVQVGAYSDASRAKEARSKLESAGLKTYTQVVETKEGPRTRVRVGPFADKDEAGRVAQKIKSLDLPAAILSL